MDIQRFISDNARSVEASGIRRVFNLSAGLTNPIDLSIGQPDFEVPDPVREAAIKAIERGFSKYTVTQGMQPLRDVILSGLKDEFPTEPGLLVTCGVSGGLTLSMMACLNAGDEVVFLDPYFVSYLQLARMIGAKPVPVDTYPDFRLHAERLERAITKRSKMLLLNYPNNPTGTMLTDQELRVAAELAEKHDLLIVADEIYRELVFDGPCPSVVRWAPERTVVLRGFGKGYGMTGWRLGYAVGPKPVIEQMTKLQQFTFVCAPSMVQHAGITAVQTDISQHARDYARKRDIAYGALRATFDPVRPTGGFYVFPKAPRAYENATAFVEKAIQNNVLVIPGCAFSQKDTHFRVSFAAPDDTIRRGCEILCKLATS